MTINCNGPSTEPCGTAKHMDQRRRNILHRCSGGLNNTLYVCSLADEISTKDGEPRKVLLRIYGLYIVEEPDKILTDSVLFALLAEKGMGPKLFGFFTAGRIEEYIPVCCDSVERVGSIYSGVVLIPIAVLTEFGRSVKFLHNTIRPRWVMYLRGRIGLNRVWSDQNV